MTTIRNYTDRELLDRFKSLPSFRGYPEGYFDILMRSGKDAPNRFDDKFYTFFNDVNKPDEEPVFCMVTSGTTNTGLFGLKKWFTYNKKGVAVLKTDVIVYNSHVLGKHKGKYPAYVQSYEVGFPYYRDNNSNNKSEEIGQVYYDRIGANCHKAGWFSEFINRWSLACLVRNVSKKYDEWMKLLNGQKYLTVTILSEF